MKLEDLTVLYAEDENAILQTVTEVLELYVNKVITANDGAEAIELYEIYKPSILLLDINMPHKDGLSALKEIRQKDINIPVIIMTAHTEKEYLMNAVELYITKYLVKPFDKDALLDALNSCVELLQNKNDEVLYLNNEIKFNYTKQTIIKSEGEISLNKKERLLLNLLIENKNKVLPYESIEYHVWEDPVSMDALKSLIKDLRKKTSKELIRNVSKIGYKLEINNV